MLNSFHCFTNRSFVGNIFILTFPMVSVVLNDNGNCLSILSVELRKSISKEMPQS